MSCKSFFLTPLQREDEHVGSRRVVVNNTGGDEAGELVSVVKSGCFLHTNIVACFSTPEKLNLPCNFSPQRTSRGQFYPHKSEKSHNSQLS